MKFILLLLLSFPALATEIADSPVPIFLKYGYSSVLEFDERPTQVVLGDVQSFQVEQLKASIILRPLVEETTSNMFIYFKGQSPRLFILNVSDESEPTLYKKFISMRALAAKKTAQSKKPKIYKRETRLIKAAFDKKKDYFNLEVAMSADSSASIQPLWNKSVISYKKQIIKPNQVWAERQVVQKDSKVTARFVFKRPNIPRTLKGVRLQIPLKGFSSPVYLTLRKGGK